MGQGRSYHNIGRGAQQTMVSGDMLSLNICKIYCPEIISGAVVDPQGSIQLLDYILSVCANDSSQHSLYSINAFITNTYVTVPGKRAHVAYFFKIELLLP